jgi:phage terminase large subunit-like protein
VSEILGRQEPTFLWVPEHDFSLGTEVVELAAAAGLMLDPWQRLLVKLTCALDPVGAWLCFEVCCLVSRQNGKGAWLQALELAWLFLFGDRLIIHSAHLFETSREHFIRMQALIRDNDDFSRRVKRMREGRGAEEIELVTGQRLKFMTRKGGAGRGFTGNKVVLDEAMYLDAMMMAAALPTLATVPNAQVVYAGSAGMKHSTQLAAVRRRGYASNDPALLFAEWAAEKAVYGPQGELLAGDDPGSPQTWAKVNPGYGIRITQSYIRKEMAALGGARSPQFGTERLGIGDWPEDDETWEVISKEAWQAAGDRASQIVEHGTIALAIDADPDRAMGTIGVCGLRADGRRHIEVVERHRGTGWILGAAAATETPGKAPGEDLDPDRGLTDWEQAIVDRMADLKARHRVCAVAVLKTSTAASLITALVKAGLPVQSPSEIEYAQACGGLYEAIVEKGTLVHLDQPSMNTAVGGARKRSGVEGGWRWSREAPVDAAPIVVGTLAMWAHERFAPVPRSKVW